MLDRLLFNGIVHTMDEGKPEAQAIGIKDGKICFVGSDEEAAALEAKEKVDLKKAIGIWEATLFPTRTSC